MMGFVLQYTRLIFLLILWGIFFSVPVGLSPLSAQQINAGQTVDGSDGLPVALQADQIDYDRENSIITASGSVSITRGDEQIKADTISYNQEDGMITASGNISLSKPGQPTLFADYMEVDSQWRDGIVENLLVQLDENARLVANGGVLREGRYTEMARATYSPCLACAENPDRPLVWQVKANRIVHDAEERSVTYYDSRLEVLGVPVFYTPYLTHPDPGVERKSGLLAPGFGFGSDIGAFIRQPVYYVFDENRDATIEPIYTAEEGTLLNAEYRHNRENAEFQLNSSYTSDNLGDSGDGSRYHHALSGKIYHSPEWRTTLDVATASDRDYLADYNFWPGMNKNYLTSTLELERFQSNSYLQARSLQYQELRDDISYDHGDIAPNISYSAWQEADQWGGGWNLDSNYRHIAGSEETVQSDRLSLDGYYTLTNFWSGLVTESAAGLRGDLYKTEFSSAAKQDNQFEDQTETRAIPHAHVKARFPFIRQTGIGEQIIEPVTAAFFAPNGVADKEDIANEDSLVTELDDTNLLAFNRAPGLDRVEGGNRFVVGGQFKQFFKMAPSEDDGALANITDTVAGALNGANLTVFAGQSYRPREDLALSRELGIEDGASDFVGRSSLTVPNWATVSHRYNLDPTTGSFRKNEVDFSLGQPAFKVEGGYNYLSEEASVDDTAVEKIYATLSSQVTDTWSTSLFSSYDLDVNNSVSSKFSIIYEDECFILDSSLRREYDEDQANEDIIFIKLTFKTLGEVSF